MKKALLLISALCLGAVSYAQDPSTVIQDCTPSAWKFDKMEKGTNMSQYFFKEALSLGANFKLPTRSDNRTGFRWADNSTTGGFGVALYGTGLADAAYADIDENLRADMDAYYKAWTVVDGNAFGNVLIYNGKSFADAQTWRAAKCDSTIEGGPNIYFVTPADIAVDNGSETVYYRYTFRLRTIMPESIANGGITFYMGNSWWDGEPFAGSNRTSGYGNFTHTAYSELNDYWTEYVWEVEAKQTGTIKTYSQYDIAPLLLKLGLGYPFNNNATVIFDDIKLERVSKVTVQGDVEKTTSSGKVYYYGYIENDLGEEGKEDEPSGVYDMPASSNGIMVTADDNTITVIDALSTISIYDASGRRVAESQPTGSMTTLSVPGSGVFVVSCGSQSKKVVK